MVKDYLKFVTEEQLKLNLVPKQATPILVGKVRKVISYIDREIQTCLRSSPFHAFIMLRDRAFILALMFTGDRANDLAISVKSEEIVTLSNGGLLLNHVWGKTLRDGTARLVALLPNIDVHLCPVRAIHQYVDMSRSMGVTLSPGFLFRSTNKEREIVNAPITTNAANARLQLYLQKLDIFQGETIHGFRSSCAIALALSGTPHDEIMQHVGWKRPQTASYYTQLSKVMLPSSTANTLSVASFDEIQRVFTTSNELTGASQAFPPL